MRYDFEGNEHSYAGSDDLKRSDVLARCIVSSLDVAERIHTAGMPCHRFKTFKVLGKIDVQYSKTVAPHNIPAVVLHPVLENELAGDPVVFYHHRSVCLHQQ